MLFQNEHIITVTFDPPFWIILFENHEKGKYTVAKEVIGTSEPTNAELILFLDELDYRKIRYTSPVTDEYVQNRKPGFKKMQKKIKKGLEQSDFKYTYSKAQRELKKQQTESKLEKQTTSRKQKKEVEKQKFDLRQQKKKQKLRGR